MCFDSRMVCPGRFYMKLLEGVRIKQYYGTVS